MHRVSDRASKLIFIANIERPQKLWGISQTKMRGSQKFITIRVRELIIGVQCTEAQDCTQIKRNVMVIQVTAEIFNVEAQAPRTMCACTTYITEHDVDDILSRTETKTQRIGVQLRAF